MDRITNILKKTVKYIYIIMFTIILFILFFMGNKTYPLQRNHITSNLIIMPLIAIVTYILLRFKNEKEIKKKYYIYLIGLYFIIYIIQCILIKNIYFYTDWDVKVISDLVDKYLIQHNLHNEYYLTIYPNNIILTTILIILRKMPLIGSHYVNTLYFNALIVNISGILTNISFNNLKGKKTLYINYIVIPLIVLSPWITIPYSDTFALLFVSLLLCLYTKKQKNNIDYLLIILTALLGYYIKPTVIILLMAIMIAELLYFKKDSIKKYPSKIVFIFIGIVLALGLNKFSARIIDFTEYGDGSIKSFNFIHYLAMGENDETNGLYSQEDINETVKYGTKYNVDKFKKRFFGRSIKGQIEFFTNKTLINFNDGSFSWGQEGVFFYKIIPTKSKISNVLRSIYYPKGKYYHLFLQIEQILWLFTLLLCPFIVKKNNSKKEMALMLSLIGITLFLTIFEPRTRYLYCYSGVFVITALLGLDKLKTLKLFNRK